MNKEMKIKIDEQLVNYIEGLDYEVAARRDIISFMLSNNMPVDTEAFAVYQREFNEFNAQFQLAKHELEKKYIKDGTFNWRLDYADKLLTITPKGSLVCESGCNNC